MTREEKEARKRDANKELTIEIRRASVEHSRAIDAAWEKFYRALAEIEAEP